MRKYVLLLAGVCFLLAAVSAFLFASLYFAAGLGRRITTQAELEALRMALGIDLSVLVAAAHVVSLMAWSIPSV